MTAMKNDSAVRPPVVLLPACQRVLGRHPFHVAGKKYVEAIRLAGAVPLVIPGALPEEIPTLLALADESLPVEVEYGLAHPVQMVPGGLLEQIMAGLNESVLKGHQFMVNSQHGQGVNRLAPGFSLF